MMRRNQAASFKILLENKGDMNVTGNFQSIEKDKTVQFYIPKEKVSIDAKSKAILEIKAVHKEENNNPNETHKPEIIHKLVIAKIKDCEFKYSIIFEITLV